MSPVACQGQRYSSAKIQFWQLGMAPPPVRLTLHKRQAQMIPLSVGNGSQDPAPHGVAPLASNTRSRVTRTRTG